MDNYEGVMDLVLEGGGVKGIGLVGAVKALYDKGYSVGELGRVAGTSAGAIVASLVAARMPVPEMVELMRTIDYRRFRDSPPLGPIGRGFSLLTRLGLYKGDFLHRWIADRLAECGVRTFKDLRVDDPESNLPPGHRYRLVVVVSDITSGRMARLPWDFERYGLDPDEQPVADAVRASAAIPYFFRPSRLKLPDRRGVAILTDGGMLSNYPIHIFDRLDGKPRWPTFGVKLSPRPADRWNPSWNRVNGPVTLARALVTTMANAHDRMAIDAPSVRARTVFVETNGVKATDFDLAAEKRDQLYERGHTSAGKFLAEWNFAEYLRKYRRPQDDDGNGTGTVMVDPCHPVDPAGRRV